MSILDKVQAAMQGEPKWALLYMMVAYTDGTYEGMPSCNPVKPIKSVWPEVHGYYDTEAEAFQIAATKSNPKAYFVRRMRNYTGSGI